MTARKIRMRFGKVDGTFTPRDLGIAYALLDCDFLATDQVARLFFHDGFDAKTRRRIPGVYPAGSSVAARRRLYALCERNMLDCPEGFPLPTERRGEWHKTILLWRLSKDAFEFLGPAGEARPEPISHANTLHHLAVTEIYARVVGRLRFGGLDASAFGWTSERVNQRAFVGADGQPGSIRPDARVVAGAELYLLERQRGAARKTDEELRRRVRNYARYLEVAPPTERDATVLFACDAERDARAVNDAGDALRDAGSAVRVAAGSPQEIEDELFEAASDRGGVRLGEAAMS